MIDRDFIKLLPTLSIGATSPRTPLPQSEILIPVLKERLISNQLIEALVIKSEPKIDTGNNAVTSNYGLDLQTAAGVLKLVSNQMFEPGTVLLLRFDAMGNPEIVIPDSPELKLIQLKAALQQQIIRNLPSTNSDYKWIANLTRSFHELPTTLLPDPTRILMRYLENQTTTAPESLKFWLNSNTPGHQSWPQNPAIAKNISKLINLPPAEFANILKIPMVKAEPANFDGKLQNPVASATNIQTNDAPKPSTKILNSSQDSAIKNATISPEPVKNNLSTKDSNIANVIYSARASDTGTPQQNNPVLVQQLAAYAMKFTKTTPNEKISEILKVLVADILKKGPDSTTNTVNAPIKEPQLPGSSAEQLKDVLSSKVMQIITKGVTNSNVNNKTENQSAEFGTRLKAAFTGINTETKQIPLDILLANLESQIVRLLSSRPDSIALQLQSKAAQILSESQNTYSPSLLTKKAVPIGPKVTNETRLLDSMLNDIRSGISRNHIQTLTRLGHQITPDTERSTFSTLEIPIVLPGMTETGVLEVSQKPESRNKNGKKHSKVWHFRFHLNFAPLPPSCTEIFYQRVPNNPGEISLTFWSLDAKSLQLFSDYQEVFESSLRQKGFNVTTCQGKRGLPEKAQKLETSPTSMVDIHT